MYSTMKKTVFVLFPMALSLLFWQCEKTDPPLLPSGAAFSCDDSPATCELTAANGNFAIDLFKQLDSEKPAENIFISPFSVSTALTMTANGAAGQTLTDMLATLRINDLELASVNDSYQQLLEVLPKLDPQSKLELANSIWPQKDYPVLQTFLDLNAEKFNSEVLPVDFKDPAVIEMVNNWIEENTNGLIQNALTELPADVVMLLINAIYFKGAWQTEFDPDNTYAADFHTAAGPKEVDMMHIPENDFPYFQTELFQAVDLPYGDSIFSMSIFLPKDGHELGEVVEALNAQTYDEWISSFTPSTVELHLPKFELEYDAKLKRTLSDLGMSLAFTGSADFSKMVDGGGLYIDEVIHKAFLEVNEEGTEAAAVTIVVIVETSVPLIPNVNINKPFLFVIRDNQTNSILFMGKVMDPTI